MTELIYTVYRVVRWFKHWELFHECKNFRHYQSQGYKQCHDCGKKTPLYDLKIKHQR